VQIIKNQESGLQKKLFSSACKKQWWHNKSQALPKIEINKCKFAQRSDALGLRLAPALEPVLTTTNIIAVSFIISKPKGTKILTKGLPCCLNSPKSKFLLSK
jgi:hypothetical protein